MSDVRERHVMGHADPDQGCEPVCVYCETLWPCDAIQQADDADRLAAALREAVAVAHETDSLRSHSDDQRTDGWFRAPLDRCEDAICEDARDALRQHEEATR